MGIAIAAPLRVHSRVAVPARFTERPQSCPAIERFPRPISPSGTAAVLLLGIETKSTQYTMNDGRQDRKGRVFICHQERTSYFFRRLKA